MAKQFGNGRIVYFFAPVRFHCYNNSKERDVYVGDGGNVYNFLIFV